MNINFAWIIFVFCTNIAFAQRTNILFVVDGSQSMLASWGSTNKMEIAKASIDEAVTIMSKKSEVYCALRMFGSNSPFAKKDCNDSKLVVPFGSSNVREFYNVMEKIYPRGITPISYALEQSANDFPNNTDENIIILMTDGEESCNRNPCEIIEKLKQQNIKLKSFVIGFGLDKTIESKFKCIGNFYNAANPLEMKTIFSSIISSILRSDALFVELLDKENNPRETDVMMRFENKSKQKIENAYYYHSMVKGKPDSLKLNVNGNYTFTAFTKPNVIKENITLLLGEKTIIQAESPQGQFVCSDLYPNNFQTAHHIIISKDNKAVFTQKMNETQAYIVGKYQALITSLPYISIPNIDISQSKLMRLKIPNSGTLSVSSQINADAFIMHKTTEGWKKIYTLNNKGAKENINLQPGKYRLLYRNTILKQSEASKSIDIKIESNKTQEILLN